MPHWAIEEGGIILAFTFIILTAIFSARLKAKLKT